MNSGSRALALLSACERLTLSRQRLHQALSTASAPPGAERSAGSAGVFADWRAELLSLPGASLLLPLVTAWWASHPYRLLGIALADLAKTVLLPTAQRHPWRLLAGAFAVGAVLAWSRPWRWHLFRR